MPGGGQLSLNLFESLNRNQVVVSQSFPVNLSAHDLVNGEAQHSLRLLGDGDRGGR